MIAELYNVHVIRVILTLLPERRGRKCWNSVGADLSLTEILTFGLSGMMAKMNEKL